MGVGSCRATRDNPNDVYNEQYFSKNFENHNGKPMIVRDLVREWKEASILEGMFEVKRADYILKKFGDKAFTDLGNVVLYAKNGYSLGIVLEFEYKMKNSQINMPFITFLKRNDILGNVLDSLRSQGLPVYMTRNEARKDGFKKFY